MDYANSTNVEFIVDPRVLFHGWLISLHLHEENWLQFSNSKQFFSQRIHNHLRGFLFPSSSSLFVLNFKPPLRRHVGAKKKIEIEQVALSARLTREDKVMLSCLNSMTSLILELKTREVLRDWYLNHLLLEEKFVLPATTPVSLKNPEFLQGKLEGLIGVQVISYLLPYFPPFRCSCFKTIWFCYENFPY